MKPIPILIRHYYVERVLDALYEIDRVFISIPLESGTLKETINGPLDVGVKRLICDLIYRAKTYDGGTSIVKVVAWKGNEFGSFSVGHDSEGVYKFMYSSGEGDPEEATANEGKFLTEITREFYGENYEMVKEVKA